jgi:hypothetical protein
LKKVADIYKNTFGYNLRLGALTVLSNSIEANSSPKLLDTYRQQSSNDADLSHLFTAQRGYIDAIGLAYIGSACVSPSYARGFTDYASGFPVFVETLAHEIGHNLNATHDNTEPDSIMSISGKKTFKNPFFSAFSVGEISSFVNSNGSCLNDISGSALSTEGSYRGKYEKRNSILLSVTQTKCGDKRCLVGTVTNKSGNPLPGRVIELLTSKGQIVKTTFTNKNGAFSFKLKKSGKFYVVDRMARKASALF